MAEKTVRAPEKHSNFSITCNLLSQYIKQKGSLSDLMASRPTEAKGAQPITMNLLPGLKVDNESETKKVATDLFGKHGMKEENAQLTIFYGGKVLVFDNFPAEKAKDLIEMANATSLTMQNFSFITPSSPAAGATEGDLPSKCDDVNVSSFRNEENAEPDQMSKPAQTTTSNMPVARRASLHRFLEKRKDRINAKAPYQLNGSSVAPAKPEDRQAWLGLGPKEPNTKQ